MTIYAQGEMVMKYIYSSSPIKSCTTVIQIFLFLKLGKLYFKELLQDLNAVTCAKCLTW